MNIKVSSYRQTNTVQKQSDAPQYSLDASVDSSTSVGTVMVGFWRLAGENLIN
jgi:hypothetical protein